MPPAAARPSARYRFVVILSVLAVMLLGFFALGRLSIDLLPAHEAPRLTVQVSAPGLTAPVIEETLTRRLEDLLTGVTGVAAMESVTTSGGVSIDLPLKHRRDIDAAQRDIVSRLERAKASWPASMDAPTISIIDAASVALEFAMVSRERDLLALRDWAEGEFAKKLRELSGVAAVDIEGGARREILVMPDQRRLAGYGLAFDDVVQAIRKNPEAGPRVRLSRAKGRSRREPMQSGDVAAVAAVPVLLPGGESIRLAEVARLVLSNEVKSAPFRFDGADAIKLTVQRQAPAAVSDVIERVQAQVDWMRANQLIPEGIEIHALSHRLDEARQSLRKIAFAFIAGFSLVLLAAHVLGGAGRRTLILGVIVATSLLGVFVAMALSRMTLDVMTLGGLTLGTGLFAGSAMLMFEDTARSAFAPAGTVNPVMAAGAAMVAALVPVLFAGGELGAWYRELVLVFCGAWLIAALLALRLVPAFDARARRREHERWNAAVTHAIARARQSYGGLLHRLLRRPAVTLMFALGLTALLMAVVFVKAPVARVPSDPRGGEIVIRIQGPNAGPLATLAEDIVQRLRRVPDLRQVNHSAQAARDEFTLRMDEERARELGVDLTAAGKALAVALSGIPAGSFRDAEHRYDVRVRLPPEESGSAAALGNILLLGELEDRPAVHLRDVASVERVATPAQIRRYNGKPMIEVIALTAEAAAYDQAAMKVHAILGNIGLPAGYRMSYGRSGNALQDNRSQGLPALGMAVLLIFFVQALLHRSIRLGLLITFTAFTALVGAGATLLFFGMSLSPPVWLGALMLLGIAAGHTAVLVERGETLRSPDLATSQRVMQAARHQFRPLLAVVLLAILGMFALMWIKGAASVLHPLIVTVATGLMFSLLTNLLLAPVVYSLISRQEQTSVK